MKVILVVEDDDLKARGIQRQVHHHGMETIRAKSLSTGLVMLKEHVVGAVITDWMYPNDDGDMPNQPSGNVMVDECKARAMPVVVCSGEQLRERDDVNWYNIANREDLARFKAWLDAIIVEIPSLRSASA